PDGSLRNLRVRIARTSMMCLHDAHALCDGLPDLSQQTAAPQFLARPGTWVALNRSICPREWGRRNGRWQMTNGGWQMTNGGWRMGDDKCRHETRRNGPPTLPGCQKVGGPWYVVSLRELENFFFSLRHPDYSAAIGTFPVPFPGGVRMATRFKSRTRRSRRYLTIVKPSGSLHPRVQKVGPEHFGIVAVDCAKARSKWMLADFYGRILIPPSVVEH